MTRPSSLRAAFRRLVSSLAAIAAVCMIFAVKAIEQQDAAPAKAPTQIAEADAARPGPAPAR